jgi:hypothetical protein
MLLRRRNRRRSFSISINTRQICWIYQTGNTGKRCDIKIWSAPQNRACLISKCVSSNSWNRVKTLYAWYNFVYETPALCDKALRESLNTDCKYWVVYSRTQKNILAQGVQDGNIRLKEQYHPFILYMIYHQFLLITDIEDE